MRVLTWLTLAGCGGGIVCDPAEVPISDRQGFSTAQDRLRVRSLLEKFERWSGFEVCLSEVEIVSDLETVHGKISGRWTSGRRRVQLEEATGLDESTVFHELCHAIDTDHALSERHADLFPIDAVPAGGNYSTDRHRRREHFARRCEVGPVGPVMALVEERCGDRTAAWIEREIWSAMSPEVDLRLAPSPDERDVLREQLEGSWEAVGAGAIERDHRVVSLGARAAEIRFLTDDARLDGPPRWLPWEAQLDAQGWRTLGAPDQVLWAPQDGVPWLLDRDRGGAREVALPADSWRGGWAGDSWWLWAPGRPLDQGLKRLDVHGALVESLPLPSLGLGPLVEVDGEPWLQDLGRHRNRVRDASGEEVLTLPRHVLLSRQGGDLLLGWYSYGIDYGTALLDLEVEGLGLAWVDPAGVVYVESPCDEHDDPPDRTSSPRVSLEYDEELDVTDVIDQLRSYAVD